MKLIKWMLLLSLLLATNTLFATTETASKVVSIKSPIIDRQAIQHNATEAFMKIINNGSKRHMIIAVTSPIATEVQLHKTTTSHGHQKMKQIKSINIDYHHETDLKLGGLHVMLIGLKKHLMSKQQIPITLIFKDGSWLTVNATVS